MRIVKRKVILKNVPPDVSALKLMVEMGDGGVKNMSDEELENEKRRLLDLLKNMEDKDNEDM